MTRMSPGLNDAALAYLQREVGYERTGSHVTRAGGQESGQFRVADLIAASWYQHTPRDGACSCTTTSRSHTSRSPSTTGNDGRQIRRPTTSTRAVSQIASVHAEAALTRRFGLDWSPGLTA